MLSDKLNAKKLLYLFVDTNLLMYEEEVIKFYTNPSILEGNVATSKVYGVELVFDKMQLGKILQILLVGLAEYV